MLLQLNNSATGQNFACKGPIPTLVLPAQYSVPCITAVSAGLQMQFDQTSDCCHMTAVIAGVANDTYTVINGTADIQGLDVENAGFYILGGNSSTELVVDSESSTVATRRLFFISTSALQTSFL